MFVWGVVLVVCVCVSLSGVLFSLSLCVCDLLTFLQISPDTAGANSFCIELLSTVASGGRPVPRIGPPLEVGALRVLVTDDSALIT